MTQNFQVSKRLDDGTIVVLGGDTVDQFAGNAHAVGGESFRDEMRALFFHLIPVGAPATQQPAVAAPPVQDAWGAPGQNLPAAALQSARANPTAPPGGAPLCPNHQQPAKFVPPGVSSRTGAAYTGFWSCNQGDKTCKIRS